MYELMNLLHAWNRWVITALILLVLFRSFKGMRSKSDFIASDQRFSLLLMIFCDIQLLLGLVQYFISPQIEAAFHDFGAAMKNPVMRFWAVEHLAGMLIAIILIHVGRAKSKRAAMGADQHKKLFIFTLIAFIVMMASIPWPGMAAGRPLFHF